MTYTANELIKKFEGNKHHVRFIKDMMKIGASMGVYSARGDFGTEKPCAYTDDKNTLQVIIRATKLIVRYDTMGRTGYVVYT